MRADGRFPQIMFYYPASATIDEQLGDVGLCEGLINFTRTFSPNKPCRAVHTDLVRQVLWEPEPSIWLVLVVKRARPPKRDSDSYGDDDLSSQVLDAVLRNAYQTLRLFHGTMHRIANEKGADGLRRTLALVMPSYISTLPPISKLDLAFCLGAHLQTLPASHRAITLTAPRLGLAQVECATSPWTATPSSRCSPSFTWPSRTFLACASAYVFIKTCWCGVRCPMPSTSTPSTPTSFFTSWMRYTSARAIAMQAAPILPAPLLAAAHGCCVLVVQDCCTRAPVRAD